MHGSNLFPALYKIIELNKVKETRYKLLSLSWLDEWLVVKAFLLWLGFEVIVTLPGFFQLAYLAPFA